MSTTGTSRTSSTWRLVAAREIRVKLADKTFLISFVVTLLLVAGGIGLSGYFSGRTTTFDVAVTQSATRTLVTDAAKTAAAAGEDVEVDVRTVDDAAAARALVADGTVEAAVLPGDHGVQVVGDTDVDAALVRMLQVQSTRQAVGEVAGDAGTSLEEVLAGAQVEQTLLRPGDVDSGQRQLLGFVFAVLFLLAAMTFGITIANSVVEEKQNRVVEILAAAVPVRSLLTGKVLGSATLAMAQVVAVVAVAGVGFALTGQRPLLEAVVRAGGWFVVFFVLGFLALASLWAVAGSVATRQEDLQSTTLPVQAVLMIVYFGSFVAGDQVRTVASFVPVASSVAMPARLLAGGVPLWQPLLSAGITAAAAVLLVRLGARLYEGSLLRTDRRTSLREAFAGGR
jgi:ABC-2 type transport system permease protein